MRTDPLTGLGNRGGMQVDLDALCEQANAEDPVTLILFDLNGFKRYNDTFGHPAGDELLDRSACAARGGRRGRHRLPSGGDEFCVLFDLRERRLDAVKRKPRKP